MRSSHLLVAAVWCVGAALAQQHTGRFAALVSKGLELIDAGRFVDALNVLEEVWEQDQSDPAVAENLAIAHLYGGRDARKAEQLMEAAIAAGGRASFLMQHAHERLTLVSMDTSNFCSGRLSISRDRMTFTAANPAHSFSIQTGQLKEIKKNKWFGSSEGVYHIRTSDKKTYNLRPRTWSERETSLVMQMIEKYIKR
jgi:hypothetical protein